MSLNNLMSKTMEKKPFRKMTTGLIMSLLWLAWTGPLSAEDAEWELKKEEQGISLYFRNYPDSGIPEFKAVTGIDSSLVSVLAVLLDIPACERWVHQCQTSFILKTVNSREQYVYQINRLPLVKDRDIILHAGLTHSEDLNRVQINLAAAPALCQQQPPPACDKIEQGRYIRVHQSVGYYRLEAQGPDNVVVTWQQHIDPGGSLPGWLARSQLANLPMRSLKALKKIVKEEKYRNAEFAPSNGGIEIRYGK